jgi:hypothetical protein
LQRLPAELEYLEMLHDITDSDQKLLEILPMKTNSASSWIPCLGFGGLVM